MGLREERGRGVPVAHNFKIISGNEMNRTLGVKVVGRGPIDTYPLLM